MTLNVSEMQPDFPFQKVKLNEQKLRNIYKLMIRVNLYIFY